MRERPRLKREKEMEKREEDGNVRRRFENSYSYLRFERKMNTLEGYLIRDEI